MRYTIDQFDGTIAVCTDEHGKTTKIPKYRLPIESKEGDVVIEVDEMFRIDDEETNGKRKSATVSGLIILINYYRNLKFRKKYRYYHRSVI